MCGSDEFIFIVHLINDICLILIFLLVEFMTVVVLLLVLLELGSILLQLLQPIDIFLVVHVFYFIYLEIVSIVSNYPHHHLAGIWSIIYSFNMAALQPAKMIYRNFGNSGLKLSVISVGTAINNKPNNYEQDK